MGEREGMEGTAPRAEVNLELIPATLRKHAAPESPLPLREMAAQLLAPASPRDALTLLYLLSFDPEEAIRAQVEQSARALPEKLALPGLRDDSIPPAVLDWLAERVVANERYAELLALHPATPDEALARIVAACPEKVVELVSQNQLRLLRCDALLRAMLTEARASKVLLHRVADFAIRSGVYWEDVPELVEAHRRIHGEAPPAPPGETAAQIMADLEQPGTPPGQDPPPLDPQKRLTLTQRVLAMSIAEKIKLATLGDKEARQLLLRDANKLVCLAAVESPRLTESEAVAIANSRTIHEEALRSVGNNREFTKLYAVKQNLVKNPKVPIAIALRFLPHMREKDLRDLQRSKNVPSAVQSAARGLLLKTRR